MKKKTPVNPNIKEIFVNINFDGVHVKYGEKVDITNEKDVEKKRLKIIQQIIKDVSEPSFAQLIDTAQAELYEKRIKRGNESKKSKT